MSVELLEGKLCFVGRENEIIFVIASLIRAQSELLFMDNQKKSIFKMSSRLKKLGWEHLIWQACLLFAPAEYLETPVKTNKQKKTPRK